MNSSWLARLRRSSILAIAVMPSLALADTHTPYSAGPPVVWPSYATDSSTSLPTWPFDRPSVATLRSSDKKVIALHMPVLNLWLWDGCTGKTTDYDMWNEIFRNNTSYEANAWGALHTDRPIPYKHADPGPGGCGDKRGWWIENMREEIRRAVKIGIDAFAYVIEWDSDEALQEVEWMMDAIAMEDPGFKIALVPDMDTDWTRDPVRMANAIAKVAKYNAPDGKLNPALMTVPGATTDLLRQRLVIVPFDAHRANDTDPNQQLFVGVTQGHTLIENLVALVLGIFNTNSILQNQYPQAQRTADWWREWKDLMLTKQLPVALIPTFATYQNYAADFKDLSYGLSDWRSWSWSKDSSGNWVHPQDADAAYVHSLGTKWVHPIQQQDVRPKDGNYDPVYWPLYAAFPGCASPCGWFREAWGSINARTDWENAICVTCTATELPSRSSDWVYLVTWNDYGETTVMEPSEKIQFAYYDLAAYYITWFKQQSEPTIKRDVLYYFHRTQHMDNNPSVGSPMVLRPSFAVTSVSNDIELLAFLKTGGDLEITLGSRHTCQSVPAGRQTIRLSFTPTDTGTPTFRLSRGGTSGCGTGTTAIALTSHAPISSTFNYDDPVYWAGSSSRAAVSGPFGDNH